MGRATVLQEELIIEINGTKKIPKLNPPQKKFFILNGGENMTCLF